MENDSQTTDGADERSSRSTGSEPSGNELRREPKAAHPCVKGHATRCDNLCIMWGCKFEHLQALTAKDQNAKGEGRRATGGSQRQVQGFEFHDDIRNGRACPPFLSTDWFGGRFSQMSPSKIPGSRR